LTVLTDNLTVTFAFKSVKSNAIWCRNKQFCENYRSFLKICRKLVKTFTNFSFLKFSKFPKLCKIFPNFPKISKLSQTLFCSPMRVRDVHHSEAKWTSFRQTVSANFAEKAAKRPAKIFLPFGCKWAQSGQLFRQFCGQLFALKTPEAESKSEQKITSKSKSRG